MQATKILIGRWMKGLVPPIDWVQMQVSMYGKSITIVEENGYNCWYSVESPLNYVPPSPQ